MHRYVFFLELSASLRNHRHIYRYQEKMTYRTPLAKSRVQRAHILLVLKYLAVGEGKYLAVEGNKQFDNLEHFSPIHQLGGEWAHQRHRICLYQLLYQPAPNQHQPGANNQLIPTETTK